jgi:hypothetical protein
VLSLNVLNVADALMSRFAVAHRFAVEANPFVRLIGVPGKIAIVAILGTLLALVRPRALLWPILALAAALAYQVLGLILTAA